MNAHINSLDAFANTTFLRANRQAQILNFLREHGPATDRDVMLGLGFSEPNQVRPRLTELIEAERVCEVGARKDMMTGRTVRVVRAALV